MYQLLMGKQFSSHPAIPPDSMWLARVTSLDQTSNCHLYKPRTPHSTLPEWTPILMFKSTLVFSRTSLHREKKERKKERSANLSLSSNKKLHYIYYIVLHALHFLGGKKLPNFGV